MSCMSMTSGATPTAMGIRRLFAEFMEVAIARSAQLREGGAVKAIELGVNEWQVCEEALAHGDFDIMLLAGRYTLLEQGRARDLSAVVSSSERSQSWSEARTIPGFWPTTGATERRGKAL